MNTITINGVELSPAESIVLQNAAEHQSELLNTFLFRRLGRDDDVAGNSQGVLDEKVLLDGVIAMLGSG